MLETWTMPSYGRNGDIIAETVAVYDTELQRIVEGRVKFLKDRKEVERRIAAISPVELVIQR